MNLCVNRCAKGFIGKSTKKKPQKWSSNKHKQTNDDKIINTQINHQLQSIDNKVGKYSFFCEGWRIIVSRQTTQRERERKRKENKFYRLVRVPNCFHENGYVTYQRKKIFDGTWKTQFVSMNDTMLVDANYHAMIQNYELILGYKMKNWRV